MRAGREARRATRRAHGVTLKGWPTILAVGVLVLALLAPAAPGRASSGVLYAWGENHSGQLGLGAAGDEEPSPLVAALPAGVRTVEIAGGAYHTLAVAEDGTVYAWGANYAGQLGLGATGDPVATPQAIGGPLDGVAVTAVAAGDAHSLAVAEDGTVYAWGDNQAGQLGLPMSTTAEATPQAVGGPLDGVGVTAVAAGSDHSLAVAEDGTVYAWGDNQAGQLGRGTITAAEAKPQAVAGSFDGVAVTAVAAGYRHSLALTGEGRVYAWGCNEFGELGLGVTGSPETLPQAPALPDGTVITQIDAGRYHSVAVTVDGAVMAWGDNMSGQLGRGTLTESEPSPEAVGWPNDTTVTHVAGGGAHTLAATKDGAVMAWGENDVGQLGIGVDGGAQSKPVAVALPDSEGALVVAAGYAHSLTATEAATEDDELPPPYSIERLSGDDRVETAIEVSQQQFPEPGQAGAVFLARHDDYADALTAGPLAYALDAPILLTPTGPLRADVGAEIDRLGVDTAYLLGGPGAVSATVEAEVLTRPGVTATARFAGADRFATAVELAEGLADVAGPVGQVYVTEGRNPDPARGWPDAVAVSGLAAATGRPILLSDAAAVPDATMDGLVALDVGRVELVGGTAALSDAVEETLEALVLDVERISGRNRYETSVAVTQRALVTGFGPDPLWVATGLNWPDSVVGGPAVARSDGVLVLVHGHDAAGSQATVEWVADNVEHLSRVYVLGGEGAITPEVVADLGL